MFASREPLRDVAEQNMTCNYLYQIQVFTRGVNSELPSVLMNRLLQPAPRNWCDEEPAKRSTVCYWLYWKLISTTTVCYWYYGELPSTTIVCYWY